MTEETTSLLDGDNHIRIVDWDGDDDPQNPLNWPERQKWAHVSVMALLTFLVYVLCFPV